MLWSIFAYLFCASATNGCYFMEIDGFLTTQKQFMNLNNYIEQNNVGSSTIGPFGFQSLDSKSQFSCVPYSSEQIDNLLDASWKTARVFAIMANVCNGMVMLFLLASACVKYNQLALNCFAGFAFFGSICEWCVFSFFGSFITDPPFNGRFYVGAGMAIIGALCSVVTGWMILRIPQEPTHRNWRVEAPPSNTSNGSYLPQSTVPTGRRNFPSPKKSARLQETAPPKPDIAIDPAEAFAPGTETITETILPDGSTKMTKTVVDLDGSKTVTETIVKEEIH